MLAEPRPSFRGVAGQFPAPRPAQLITMGAASGLGQRPWRARFDSGSRANRWVRRSGTGAYRSSAGGMKLRKPRASAGSAGRVEDQLQPGRHRTGLDTIADTRRRRHAHAGGGLLGKSRGNTCNDCSIHPRTLAAGSFGRAAPDRTRHRRCRLLRQRGRPYPHRPPRLGQAYGRRRSADARPPIADDLLLTWRTQQDRSRSPASVRGARYSLQSRSE